MSHTGTASHVTVYSKATQQTFALDKEHSDVKKKTINTGNCGSRYSSKPSWTLQQLMLIVQQPIICKINPCKRFLEPPATPISVFKTEGVHWLYIQPFLSEALTLRSFVDYIIRACLWQRRTLINMYLKSKR